MTMEEALDILSLIVMASREKNIPLGILEAKHKDTGKEAMILVVNNQDEGKRGFIPLGVLMLSTDIVQNYIPKKVDGKGYDESGEDYSTCLITLPTEKGVENGDTDTGNESNPSKEP